MIPIVLGASKDDCKSIRKLTGYLVYLNKHDTACAAYFVRKEHGRLCEFQAIA